MSLFLFYAIIITQELEKGFTNHLTPWLGGLPPAPWGSGA